MADVINLMAESDRNIIGDDSSPTLNLGNSSSGNCLKLQNAGGTGVQLSTISCPTTSIYVTGASDGILVQTGGVAATLKSTASASAVLDLSRTILGSPTVAIMKVTSSTASACAFQFAGSCIVSTASGGATVGAAIRVKFGDKYFWMYAYENVA